MKLWNALRGRAFGLTVYGLGVFMLAGAVHIVSVLAMPRLAPRDAFTRVAALTKVGRLTLLAAVTPRTSPFAFEDPATALGVCRYNLKQGPLHLWANLQAGQMMLFSFHSRYGNVYYSMSDRVASHGRFDVLVVTPDQLDDYEAADTGDELPRQLRIVSPSSQGFVLVRAFADQADDLPAARAAISAIQCAVTKAPQV